MKAPALKIDWRAILNGLISGKKIALEGGVKIDKLGGEPEEFEGQNYIPLTYKTLGYFAMRWDTCAVSQVENHEKLACINEEIDEHCPSDRFLQTAGIAFSGAIERTEWQSALNWIDQIEERAKILTQGKILVDNPAPLD